MRPNSSNEPRLSQNTIDELYNLAEFPHPSKEILRMIKEDENLALSYSMVCVVDGLTKVLNSEILNRVFIECSKCISAMPKLNDGSIYVTRFNFIKASYRNYKKVMDDVINSITIRKAGMEDVPYLVDNDVYLDPVYYSSTNVGLYYSGMEEEYYKLTPLAKFILFSKGANSRIIYINENTIFDIVRTNPFDIISDTKNVRRIFDEFAMNLNEFLIYTLNDEFLYNVVRSFLDEFFEGDGKTMTIREMIHQLKREIMENMEVY